MSSHSFDLISRAAREFKVKHGLTDESDTSVVTALHLMNAHDLDLAGAQERTSRGSADHGIDGWFFDTATGTLYLYQSKLSVSRALAMKGLDSLYEAAQWVGEFLNADEISGSLRNAAIYNLAQQLASDKGAARTIKLVLLSPLDVGEIENSTEYEYMRGDLGRLPLAKLLRDRGGKLVLSASAYKTERGGIPPATEYSVAIHEELPLSLGKRSQLFVTLLSLRSLVELFRRRGNLVFEKNVRLYLNTKESRSRVEHPLEITLGAVAEGALDPNLFPAYHVGVALTAAACGSGKGEQLVLEAPYIINGCQTVNVASRFLAQLEKAKQTDKISRFNQINVIAKVITRAPDDQLREIAICNNRQNPIESWQLFSNDPVHIEIEAALKSRGIFYERQKGKFASDTSQAKLMVYSNTNGAFVEVVALGQAICLCKGDLVLAAKPSEIFAGKEEHDAIFTQSIAELPIDIVWAFNAMKALRRSLNVYVQKPAHADDASQALLSRPMVRQALYYLGMLHLVQRRTDLHSQFIRRLNKKASPTLVDALDPLWQRVITKVKQFCNPKGAEAPGEISYRRLDDFLDQLTIDINLDREGPMPFTEQGVEWPDPEEEPQ